MTDTGAPLIANEEPQITYRDSDVAKSNVSDNSNFRALLSNSVNKHPDDEDRPSKALRLSQMRPSMKHSYRVSFVGEHGLTTFTGVLAILSTIIGGGIVSIPYSFVSFGIPIGIGANILAVFLTALSCDLYMAAKDIVPDKPESFYEIGYMTMGRNSIFMVGLAQFINSFGLMLVYFIVFGDTTAQLVANVANGGVMDIWWCERFFYVLVLALLLAPVILKKELAELEWLSWVLFGAIGLFIAINLWQLEGDQNF